MPIVPGTYWDLLERDTPPVKRRAAHAKARTGCLTCKRRRVKCDEAKPGCARCAKSGHRCAGYEDGSSNGSGAERRRRRGAEEEEGGRSGRRAGGDDDDARGNGLRHARATLSAATPPPLRPKPPATTTMMAAAAAAVVVSGGAVRGGGAARKLNLLRASLVPTYLEARDVPYFERFKCQMLADLGTWCGAEYWRHTILREVLLDRTVQHAAIAAAAMLMDMERQQHEAAAAAASAASASGKRRPLSFPGSLAEEEEEHDGDANGTGTAAGVGSGRAMPVVAVVSLSNRSTHGKAALWHYMTALGLCRRALAAEGLTSATARSSLTVTFFFAVFELVQGNVGEADRLLASGASLLDDALSRPGPDGNGGGGGGGPALVPDNTLREIQLAFDRMRVAWDLCPYFGTGDGDGDGDGDDGRRAHAGAGPALGPVHCVRRFAVPSLDASVRTKQVFWNAFSGDFGQFMARARRRGLGAAWGGEDPLPALLAQRAGYLAQLRRWLPVLDDLCARDPGSAVLCTTRAYAQTAVVFLDCFLDPSDLAYDAYLPVFRDIVGAYRRLLSPSSSGGERPREGERPPSDYLRLTLDVDLFHIITFTVGKCRDRETRALALRVFAEMTRQQALWSNSAMLAALRALADLENKGRDADGFVPASARYCYSSSTWDFRKRQMMAVFVPVWSATPQVEDNVPVRIPISF